MKVKELRQLIQDSDQRVIVEDNWVKFVDSSVYDSDICADDEIDHIYIDDEKTLHICICS